MYLLQSVSRIRTNNPLADCRPRTTRHVRRRPKKEQRASKGKGQGTSHMELQPQAARVASHTVLRNAAYAALVAGITILTGSAIKLPFQEGKTLGVIYVDRPEVVTRERLIKDRRAEE